MGWVDEFGGIVAQSFYPILIDPFFYKLQKTEDSRQMLKQNIRRCFRIRTLSMQMGHLTSVFCHLYSEI